MNPKIQRGKFAIFQGEVGIIVNTNVPIDVDGHPTNPVGSVINEGVEQPKNENPVAYYAVEFHPIVSEGTTKMRLIEDDKGNPLGVETDVKYLVGSAVEMLEVLESNDSRIPENRRSSV